MIVPVAPDADDAALTRARDDARERLDRVATDLREALGL